MTEKSQSHGASEIGRAPRHSQQNFLVQEREPNLRGAPLAAQVNTGVEEDTRTDMLMLICHTMKTNCNYQSVCLQRFRASWAGGGAQSSSKYIVQYHHFTLSPGTWLTTYITYTHELWKMPSLVIASNKQSSHWKDQRSMEQANLVTGGCDLPGTWVWVPRVRTCDDFPCSPFSSSSIWKYLPSPT